MLAAPKIASALSQNVPDLYPERNGRAREELSLSFDKGYCGFFKEEATPMEQSSTSVSKG